MNEKINKRQILIEIKKYVPYTIDKKVEKILVELILNLIKLSDYKLNRVGKEHGIIN